VKWSRHFRLGHVPLILLLPFLAVLCLVPLLSSVSLAASPESVDLWAWGANNSGQLGTGTNDNSNVPVKVSGLTDVIDIAIGSDGHTMALKSDGTIWAWGSNTTGQLGNGTNDDSNVPVQVSGLTDVIDIAAGGC